MILALAGELLKSRVVVSTTLQYFFIIPDDLVAVRVEL